MKHRLGLYVLLALTSLCGLWYFGVGAAEASPPAPITYTLTQPDGASFPAQSRGDEWRNWVETVDGYSIVRNDATGYWEYATLTTREDDIPGQGRVKHQVLAPSGLVVGHDQPQGVTQHAAPESVQPFMASPSQRGMYAPNYVTRPPHKGGHPTMILRVSFTNENFHTTEADWATAIFADVAAAPGEAALDGAPLAARPADATDSSLLAGRVGLGMDKLSVALPTLKRYWLDNSYNNIVLQPITESSGTANNGVVQVALNYTHPNTTTFGLSLQQVARDAIVAADPYVNYAALDTDNSGELSNDELHVVFVLAGAEAAYGNGCGMGRVWAHKWGIWMVTAPSVDGKTVGHDYTMMGEMDCSGDTAPGHQATIGTIAHELGHDMGSGVPDLYDGDGGSSGIGAWGLQGGGGWNSYQTGLAGTHPAHSSAWEKWLMGLVTPSRPATGATVNLEAVETSTSASHGVVQVLDNPGGVEMNGSGEYFLLENRQQVGFDKSLPGAGLLIWHVDETMSSNADQGTAAPGNRRLLTLVQADGQYDMECFTNTHCNGGDNGDPWKNSVTGLTPTSVPNSALWGGAPSNVTVSSISASSSLMTALLSLGGIRQLAVSDFDGDGRSDLLWRHALGGQNIGWLMNGTSVGSGPGFPTVADTAWKVAGIGDLNGDGKADLVWRHGGSGQDIVWFMNGSTITGAPALPTVADTAWQLVGVGDLDGDGKADLVWRHGTSGQNIVWFMNGGGIASAPALPTVPDVNWKLVAVGDLNGDGKADLVWRHATAGQNIVWFMNGGSVTSAPSLPSISDTLWQVAAAGDFNGDGKTDLLWRHSVSGQNVAWLMNGGLISSPATLLTVGDPNWKIVSAGDYNNDGKADLVWRYFVTGQNTIWLMDSGTIASAAALPTVADLGWRLVSPTSLFSALNGLLPGPTKTQAAPGKLGPAEPMGSLPNPAQDGLRWTPAPVDAAPMWTAPAVTDGSAMWSPAPQDVAPMWTAPARSDSLYK